MSAPEPASVPANRWRDIELPDARSWRPAERVSVILDGDPAAAAPTVAALREQDYPRELVEILEPGARAEPGGAIVVLVAAGAVPEPGFLAAHARWHAAAGDLVSFGALVPAGGGDEPLELVCDLTRDLTDPLGGTHLAAAEATLAVRAELLAEAGGPPPAGEAPAVARLDLAQRLHSAGAVLVAEPGARARGEPLGVAAAVARAAADGRSLELELPEVAAVAALPPFRPAAPARRHARAAVTVNLAVGDADPDEALATLAGALRGELGDVEVRVEVAGTHPGYDAIAAAVAGDARARLAPSSLGERCESPVQVTVPPLAMLDPRTLADLHELALAEDVGALHVTVPGERPQDAMIEVVATGAWRRARRLAERLGEAPEALLGRLYGERWVSGVEVSTRRHGIAEPQVTEHGPLAKATDLAHERSAHLRFRDRADEMAERAATLARRTLAERLRARAERKAAERVEARLPE